MKRLVTIRIDVDDAIDLLRYVPTVAVREIVAVAVRSERADDVAEQLVEEWSPFPIGRAIRELRSNPSYVFDEPTNAELAEYMLAEWAPSGYLPDRYHRDLVRRVIDRTRNDFDLYDAERCPHTTGAGRRCKFSGSCGSHDWRSTSSSRYDFYL